MLAPFLISLNFFLSTSVAPEIREALPAVGQVLAGERAGALHTSFRMHGSGVVITDDGLVATNLHVVSTNGKPYPALYFNLIDPDHPYSPPPLQRRYQARLVAQLPRYDLALLKLIADSDERPLPANYKFHAIPLGESQSLHFLDEVFKIRPYFGAGKSPSMGERSL